jgi:hypothetical protein
MIVVAIHIAIKEMIEVISYKLLKNIDKLGFGLKREAKIARQEAGFIISLCADNICVRYINPNTVLSMNITTAIPYIKVK